jgi:plasmid stabilization system protein ParE
MRYTITKHPLVERDLFDITDLVSDYSGLEIGMRKVDEIIAFIERLVDFPKIGTIRDDIYGGLRAIPATDKAVVCFIVNDENATVHVISISYAGADWMSEIRKRT